MSEILRYGLELPEKRERIAQVCVPENLLPETQSYTSPSGRFQLDVSQYNHPNSWKYTSGTVADTTTHTIVAEVQRNYSQFWHAWVHHTNGSEYLLCGEDYQGYSVIDLTAQRISVYLPEAAQSGGGFCWRAVYPSPDGTKLAVDGCLWAAPDELVVYDFSNPTSLPLPELARDPESLDTIKGWQDDITVVYFSEVLFRASDGALYQQLSETEQDKLSGSQLAYVREERQVHFDPKDGARIETVRRTP
jgi:hypothetical protein